MTLPEIIEELGRLDKAAKAGPWYPRGPKSRDGKAVYRVGPAEEALICAMRTHLPTLLAIAKEAVK